MIPRRVAALTAAVALLLAAACGGTESETAAKTAAPAARAPEPAAPAIPEPEPVVGPPFEVTTSQVTFVDDTRPTPESPNGPEIASRTVEVWLTLPETGEPAPLVVFSHGMNGHPDAFEELHTAWAEAGYAVASPLFPLSNRLVTGGSNNLFDVPNQPGDVSFVLDELLASSADPDSDLAGRFDPDRLAAAGLSAGGATTYEAAVNDQARDERFDAAIIFAGLRFTSPDNGTFTAPTDHPVFILHGDADPVIPLAAAEQAYGDLSAPRIFATLLGGGHAGPFQDAGEGIEAQVEGMTELIHASTLAFLDRYVLGRTEAQAELLAAVDDPALTIVVSDLG